ncbi:hypothetical protein B0920_07710 [Massilia sp. KIM]|uniref:DUF6701 domain-containing protein n=1 Tax=Massilia sp. KIM TaxID=1955422 RepID=UPI00098EA315|nr:DUF6701 domain-containing protein [Massilia sp. KIM]OON63273.1 hypothetical protein B0920_07710 [Massilia sp. KIM]
MKRATPSSKAWRALLAGLALLACLFGLPPAQAQTALTLYKTFAGNINFTGTQASLRSYPEGKYACYVTSPNTNEKASLSLPFGASVVSAHLYWAGSSSSIDKTVTMNGNSVTAGRVWTASVANGIPYFSGAADVTKLVQAKGSGDYTFSGLSVNTGSPHCERNAVLGGFSLVVVYSHYAEPFRNLNIYDGFQPLYYAEVKFTMTNFRVPDNVTSNEKGRFGHVVWEGDQALSANAEAVFFTQNGSTSTLTNGSYAPAGNQFNSQSSINKDAYSVGVDFDTYEIGNFTPKQGVASATFRATEDMIILSTAVLALPSAPESDLALDLVLNGSLVENGPASYSLTVANKGPAPDDGPITVRITLPAGQTYTSATGTDWSCSALGQIVTCTYGPTLEMGQTTPAIALKTKVTKTGEMAVSATVTGSRDPDTSNNSKTHKATTVVPQAAAYKFTTIACAAGAAIGTSACPLYDATLVAGDTATVYITAVTDGKATPLSTTQTGKAALKFAFRCTNPLPLAAGAQAKAQYVTPASSAPLSACVGPDATPAWSAQTIDFPAKVASVETKFSYADVGMLRLMLQDSKGLMDEAEIVSVPDRLEMALTRSADGVENPATNKLAEPGFVRAGEPFDLRVSALGKAGQVLPSFGKEVNGYRPKMQLSLAGAGAIEGLDPKQLGELGGGFAENTTDFSGTFTWSQLGSMDLSAKVDNYLGSGRNLDVTKRVGRFYPAYFSTVVTGNFDCVPKMRCPAQGLAEIETATHSTQPFQVRVKAHDVNGLELPVFNDPKYQQAVVPEDLALSPVVLPGQGALVVKDGGLTDPTKAELRYETLRAVSFKLGLPFVADGARSGGWPAPTPVYLRATATTPRAGTTAREKLSSLQAEPEESIEGGVMVVTGRIEVANVFGSELLKTRVPMQAQFWTGTGWATTTSLDHATLLSTSEVRYTECTRALRLASSTDKTNNCVPLSAAKAGAMPLDDGRTVFSLAPVGAKMEGSVHVHVDSTDHGWLPSTRGRVSFGQYRSPVIYVREIY